MVPGMLCDVCGDVVHQFGWLQLALDGSHVVRYLGELCLCGYRVVDAEVGGVSVDA